MAESPNRGWHQVGLRIVAVLIVFIFATAIVGYCVHKWYEGTTEGKMRTLYRRYGGRWDENKMMRLTHSRISKDDLHTLLGYLKTFDGQAGLQLDGTACDDSHVTDILALGPLRVITLDDTEITDEGVKKLATIKTLKMVTLSGDAVTDASLEYLATLPELHFLDVKGTRVTEQGLDKIKKTIPTLEINIAQE
jgi:hypothetical protein